MEWRQALERARAQAMADLARYQELTEQQRERVVRIERALAHLTPDVEALLADVEASGVLELF